MAANGRPWGQLPRRLLSLWFHGADRLHDLVDRVRRIEKIDVDVREAATKTAKQTGAIRAEADRIRSRVGTIEREVSGARLELRGLREDLGALRAEVGDRLLQYNLQLGRVSQGRGGTARKAPALAARAIPMTIDPSEVAAWRGDARSADPDDRDWIVYETCPLCGGAERTLVSEWNKFVVTRRAPDASSARYNYCLCHSCGSLYAARRPCGGRFRYLTEHFGDAAGRKDGAAQAQSPMLNPDPLSEADRETLRRLARPGVFVSEHAGISQKDQIPGLLRDRFENSVHIDVIGSLLEPRGARVLEVRSRAGTIVDGLRRLYGADVCAMAIFESQQFLLREVYGIKCASLIDFDHFDIPYDGTFDLIVLNHMMTHALRPRDMLAVLRRRLSPGGHIYLYNEPDDADFLEGAQSLLASMNALHVQTFDGPALRRALAANGFDVVFQHRRRGQHLCLAKVAGVAWTPVAPRDLERRLAAYAIARDRAVLRLPAGTRAQFADEWPDLVARAVAHGLAEFDEKGDLRIVAR